METVDHIATALAKLPDQFRDKETWIKSITALVRPMQALEVTLQALLLQRQLDYAAGAQLTTVGRKVGQPRNGVTDDVIYRRYVRARVRANRSRGTIEDVIVISVLIVNDEDATHRVHNEGNATMILRIEGVAMTAALSDILIDFLRPAVAAGVRIILETSEYPPSETFTWDTGPGWDVGHFADSRD